MTSPFFSPHSLSERRGAHSKREAIFGRSLLFLLQAGVCVRSGPNGPIVPNLGNITFLREFFFVQLDKLHFPIPALAIKIPPRACVRACSVAL